MRKILKISFIFVLIFSFFSEINLPEAQAFTVFPENSACTALPGVMGDLNHDSVINQNDEAVITKMLSGSEPFSPCADFDGDGGISPGDLTNLSNLIMDINAGRVTAPITTLWENSFYNPARVPACGTVLGDVNGDLKGDYQDVDIIEDMTADKLPKHLCGDLDSDGYVSPGDISIISNISVGFASQYGFLDKPVITRNGSISVTNEVLTAYTDLGATATDNQDGDLTSAIVTTSAVDTNVLGTYTVTYNVTDSDSNNAVPVTRTVNIVDTTAPVISLTGSNPQNIKRADAYTELGATANDNYDGNLTGAIVIDSSNVDTSVVGSYTVSYKVTDSSGNTTTVARTVNVNSTGGITAGDGGVVVPDGDSGDSDSDSGDSGDAGSDDEGLAPIVLGEKFVNEREAQLNMIHNDAAAVWPGDTGLLMAYMDMSQNSALENEVQTKYASIFNTDVRIATQLEDFNQQAITNFIAYGTKTTLILGAGERAGVLNSYKAAFDKLPKSESEWRDAIKIANGRWPGELSQSAESNAKNQFEIVYLRDADMDNSNDNAAVTVIAYGLRPSDRNLDSEAAAIKIFTDIYDYAPTSATDWDIVRAIAYSGATR